ncbi:MAG TPA: methylmalonyl-CoA epimerase [Acidobacteriaceae bacterium]|jgi:methylmalonyl-CoA epimerase|nr:methylmalonyl-CoA epimerase [Acidobacteriaceae bacterium]
MFRIDHLGIAVRDLQQARLFYELLGMNVGPEEVVEHEQVRTAMIPVGESRIELLEPLSQESVIGRFLERRGEGMHHVALHVDDIAEVFSEMKVAGMRLVSDELKIGAGGHLYFFVHPSSTGGVLIEICQNEICQNADAVV